MLSGYSFSKQGISHLVRNMPCQDSSILIQIGDWYLAAGGDGLGSCKHSDAASQIAVNTLCRFIGYAFPNSGDEDILAVFKAALHAAANFVEKYAADHGYPIGDCHTTLCAALYNGSDLYYANAGDSGVIALDEFGQYHIMTTKHNNEYGEVYPLADRRFEVGKADFKVAAVACLTDGLLDWIAPRSLSDYKYKINVPRAGILIDPRLFGFEGEITDEDFAKLGRHISKRITRLADSYADGLIEHKKYGLLSEGNLKDDLSAAVIINTDSLLRAEDIKWEAPPVPTVDEEYLMQLHKLEGIYHERAEGPFLKLVMGSNEGWDRERALEYLNKLRAIEASANNSTAEEQDKTSETPEQAEKPASDDPQAEEVTDSKDSEESDNDFTIEKKKGTHSPWKFFSSVVSRLTASESK